LGGRDNRDRHQLRLLLACRPRDGGHTPVLATISGFRPRMEIGPCVCSRSSMTRSKERRVRDPTSFNMALYIGNGGESAIRTSIPSTSSEKPSSVGHLRPKILGTPVSRRRTRINSARHARDLPETCPRIRSSIRSRLRPRPGVVHPRSSSETAGEPAAKRSPRETWSFLSGFRTP